MLQPANYDARPHSKCLSQLVNRVVCKQLFSDKLTKHFRRNECFGCELISLILKSLHLRINNRIRQISIRIVDDKVVFLTVQ